MQQLKDILPHVLAKFRHNRSFENEAVAWHWRNIVGDEIARHARPIKVLRGGMLLVAVDSPVWAHHLNMLARELLDKVNAELPGIAIKSLRFQAGYLSDGTNEDKNEHKQETDRLEQSLTSVPLTPAEQQQAVMLAASAGDPTLRHAAAEVIRQYYRWRKQCLAEKWHPCASCQALCPPGEILCSACSREQRQAHAAALRRLLMDMPWASYQQAAPFVHCNAVVYQQAKHHLAEDIMLRLSTGRSLSPQRDAAILTMLKTGLEPQNITPDIIQQSLGYNICKILAGRQKKDVSARWRGHGSGDEGYNSHRRR